MQNQIFGSKDIKSHVYYVENMTFLHRKDGI